ncbi:MAG: alpha/beta hydrolase [Gammaproteobacteria bacterium]
MRALVQMAAVLLMGYVLLLGLLYVFQSRLIYFPNVAAAHSEARPTDIGLRYENVTFRTSDGLELHGWFVPADPARGVLLFMHGNAGNITHRLDSIALFNRLGLSVFIFDYRGFGKSEGTPSEYGTYEDAGAAWRYLTEDRAIVSERIVLFGRSLGAAIAAQLASRTSPATLILESAFTSAPDIAAHHYWYFPVRLLSRFDYDTEAYAAQITCPLLVVHSPDDEIIPFEHGEAIFAAAKEPKTMLRITGSHNEGFLASGTVYVDGLRAFLKEHLPQD